MATVNAFNELMDQFLTELNLAFPENKSVIKFQSQFEVLRRTKPDQCLKSFMKAVKPYTPKISGKDETFILDDSKNIKELAEIDLKSMWLESSDSTKDAIWQYLNTLVIHGTIIQTLPKETLSMIEDIAQKCASQITTSPDTAATLMSLMNTISQQK